MQNERAQSTVTVNGEQAKQELNLLESKAIRLREALIQAGKAAPSPCVASFHNWLHHVQLCFPKPWFWILAWVFPL